MHKRSLVVLLALVLAIASGTASAANWVSKNDPNDTEGSLDIKKAELLIPRGTVFGPGDPVKCRTVFFEAVVLEEVDQILCQFDIKGDQNFDVWVEFTHDDGQPVGAAALYKLNADFQRKKIKDLSPNLNGNTLTIALPRDPLRGRDGFLKWDRQTYSEDDPFDLTGAFKYTYH